jgi:hypothetical protein
LSFYLNHNENLNKNNRCGGFGTSGLNQRQSQLFRKRKIKRKGKKNKKQACVGLKKERYI